MQTSLHDWNCTQISISIEIEQNRFFSRKWLFFSNLNHYYMIQTPVLFLFLNNKILFLNIYKTYLHMIINKNILSYIRNIQCIMLDYILEYFVKRREEGKNRVEFVL